MNNFNSDFFQLNPAHDLSGNLVGEVNNPSVAIVIINWNGKRFLEKFLPSITSSTYTNKRIIVADNASTDDSIAYLKKEHPGVEIISIPSNLGFAKGYNYSLKLVNTDY